jgi:hypothetical protein
LLILVPRSLADDPPNVVLLPVVLHRQSSKSYAPNGNGLNTCLTFALLFVYQSQRYLTEQANASLEPLSAV